jgi:hypothetical protein
MKKSHIEIAAPSFSIRPRQVLAAVDFGEASHRHQKSCDAAIRRQSVHCLVMAMLA